MEVRFTRLARTSGSDHYVIFNETERIGYVHAHYDNAVNVDIIIELEIDEEEIDHVYSAVHQLCDHIGSEDLIYKIFLAKEISSGSREVDHDDLPPTRRDVVALGKAISSLRGRHAKAAGHLFETAAHDYFRSNGFQVEMGSPAQDHNKIDLIASNEGTVIPVQVKRGDISTREIKKCIEKMRNEESVVNQAKMGKKVSFGFVAKRFPPNSSILRINLECEYSSRIIFIDHEELLAASPKFKHALED